MKTVSAPLGLISMAWLTPALRVPTERIASDVKIIPFWDATGKMLAKGKAAECTP